MLLCSCTCAFLGTPFHARSRMAPPRVAREQQRARVVSKKMQNHNERSTARFSDLRNVFQQTTNLKWKHICSYTCGPRSQRLASPTRSHETIFFGQGHCAVKPSPFHPNAEAATVLAHIFAEIEGSQTLGNTPHTSTQFQHSVTKLGKNFDKFEVTVSPAQWGFAFVHDGGTHTDNASPAR